MFAFSWSFLWPWVLLRISQTQFSLLLAAVTQLEELDGINPLSTMVDSVLPQFYLCIGVQADGVLATCKQKIGRVLTWSKETLTFLFPEKFKLIWHAPENKPMAWLLCMVLASSWMTHLELYSSAHLPHN